MVAKATNKMLNGKQGWVSEKAAAVTSVPVKAYHATPQALGSCGHPAAFHAATNRLLERFPLFTFPETGSATAS
jgi:hypothetical protein